MSILAAYRGVLALTGPALPVVSFLGRLPLAMVQLGSLLLVTESSDSVALGGLVAGCLAAGQTVGGPLIGRLADRVGQRPVVLIASLVNAAAVCAVTLAALVDAPTWPLVALAALAGFTVPQIGPLARTRVVALARRRPETNRVVPAVMSLEGTLDESSFVLGPGVVGVAAAVLHPAAATLLAAALVAVCGTLFALHHTAPAGRGDAPLGRRAGNPVTVYALRASMVAQGAMFGAIQAGLTALTASLGQAGQAGLIYAAMGVTSALMGPVMAVLPERFRLPTRLRVATLALSLLSLPLLWAPSVALLYPLTALLGIAFAPHLITVFGLTERIAAPSRLSEAMAYLTSAIVAGQAVSLSLAGRLADAVAPAAAFAVATGAAVLALLLAVFGGPALRRTVPAASDVDAAEDGGAARGVVEDAVETRVTTE